MRQIFPAMRRSPYFFLTALLLFLLFQPLFCQGGEESAIYRRIHRNLTLDDDKFDQLPFEFLPRDGYIVRDFEILPDRLSSNLFFLVWDEVQLDKEDGLIHLAAFDSQSNLVWKTEEAPAPGLQTGPRLKSFADGSLLLVWESGSAGTNNFNIWGRRFSREGQPLWPLPCAISAARGNQAKAALALLKSGDMAVLWEDERGSDCDIYYQEIHPDGSPCYMPDGVAVERAEGSQRNPSFICDENSLAKSVCWEDYKNSDEPVCRVTMDLEDMSLPEAGFLFPLLLAFLHLARRSVK